MLANIEDVMREAAARWTLLAYFFLSTIFILIFASAINLDVVNGSLAGAKLFGKDVHMGGTVAIDKLVLTFDSVFAVILYAFCTFLAIFATAHLVPRMQEKGTIDLYLSRPVSRFYLLISRYIAGLVLAASNVIYLLGSIWLIVSWKTHVFHARFLLAGAIMLFVIATLLAFAFLVGVITSSTAVSIMTTYGLALLAIILAAHKQAAALVSKDWQAWFIDGLYWTVPKIFELGKAVYEFVSGNQSVGSLPPSLTLAPFLSTAAFAIACLGLAVWRFQRKEF
jgi:ABC-2 type transport system permease protein